MTIEQKLRLLADSAPNELYLFKEGSFWKAYEQSAYAICKLKPTYTPNKRYVKAVKQEVVSVGFPESVLVQLGESEPPLNLPNPLPLRDFPHRGEERGDLGTSGTLEDRMKVFVLKEGIDMEKFVEWKAGLMVKLPPNLPAKGEAFGTSGTDGTGGAITPNFLNGANGTAGASELMIVERIRNFDLSNATPMGCMMFLNELKKEFF